HDVLVLALNDLSEVPDLLRLDIDTVCGYHSQVECSVGAYIELELRNEFVALDRNGLILLEAVLELNDLPIQRLSDDVPVVNELLSLVTSGVVAEQGLKSMPARCAD